MDFVDIIKKIIDQNVRISIHYGKVTAVAVSPNSISVRLSGSSTAVTGVKYLASYSPTVNDVVVCLVNKGDVLVLGELA